MTRPVRFSPAGWTFTGLAALSLLLAVGCNRRNEYVPPPLPEVTVGRPVQRSVPEYMEFTGTTQASEWVDVRARVQGYLEGIHFEDGAQVKKGDLLFVIDPRPFRAKLDAAKADLESKKAATVRAEAVYRRTLALLRSGASTREDVDKEKGDVDVARASVGQSEAAVRSAQLDLDYTEIRAPITGLASRRLVDVGNLVTADTTLLTAIARYDPMYAYFNPSESDVLRFRQRQRERHERQRDADSSIPYPLVGGTAVGLTATPFGAGGPMVVAASFGARTVPVELELGLANEQGYPHRGWVDFADVRVDPGTGTIQVRGVFPNPEPRVLLPGLFVRIRGRVGTRPGALLVSERALGYDQVGSYLLVVNAGDVVERRSVKLGPRIDDGMRVIAEGIGPEDWVVVNGQQKARPGAKVQPVRETEPAPDATAAR